METITQSDTPMRCSICAKIFENRKSQLRHVSYCRKAKSRVTSRKKACTACTKAKTRCDMRHPECSRCLAKNAACVYSYPVLPIRVGHRIPERQSQVVDIHEFLPANEDPSFQNTVEVTALSTSATSMELVSKRTGPPPLAHNSEYTIDLQSTDSFDISKWSVGPSTNTFANTEDVSLSNSLEYTDIWELPADSFESTFSQPASTEYEGISNNTPFQSDFIIPMSVTRDAFMCDLDYDQLIPRPLKAFKPRIIPSRHFLLNKSYVLSALRSYPYMMLPNRNPPPFIHPYFGSNTSQYERKSDMHNFGQAPLDVCAAIVQMYSVKTKDNTIFIWRTIKMEQERLMVESARFSDRDTVAALQAITVYFLLRIQETNEEATNFDIPLIDTMIKLGVKVGGFIMHYINDTESPTPTWEDWIQAESLRRTMILLFLIDIFFDISSPIYAYKCDGSQMLDLALPCGRDLWKASSKAEWKREYANHCISRSSLTYGDLINFQRKEEGVFDHWLAQLDEFGTLIMAAASIPHWSEVVRRITGFSKSNS